MDAPRTFWYNRLPMRYFGFLITGIIILFATNPARADRWTDIWTLGRSGLAAEEKKDYATARRYFDAAVQKYPKASSAHFNRGRFLLGRGEYALAVKDFDTAVRLHPTY